ncbi:helix-turn-helix domain-containing protein [Mesorhizobium sp. VK22B]|uniref:Helix-turn-helix domain-containing protein n=1 Tax=Mesorhizobium captivum TaxID=3072319 RepID=A0ABU4ZBB4_9HYPH|nr:helix-turn-helix domain-containing protein [Mesorhizobium sp. VK22B]MDX8495863.1 helix-turn-helix domain-containing protein [Mesorhizobium sp. VK22B]
MALIRVKQAADYLGLSKSFLDKARCYGGGPAFMRFGNAVVYSTDDLDKWATDHRVAFNDNATSRARAA